MQSLIAAGEAHLHRGLTTRGWLVEERSVAPVAACYGRDLTDPFSSTAASEPEAQPPWLDTIFITARRDRR
jgi:hypothetical protein